MLKHAKTLLGSVLMLLMVAGVSFYFHQKNRPEPEPIIKYLATPPAPQQASPAISHQEPQTHAKPENTSTLRHSEELISVDDVETPDTPHKRHKRTTEEVENTAPSVLEGISEEEATLWVREQFEILGRQMAEKYPEIARVTELTPEEFHELYSTDEAKDAIRELALQAKDEFFADFRENLLLLPSDIRVSVLDETWTLVRKNWGEQMADTIITQIRAELGM